MEGCKISRIRRSSCIIKEISNREVLEISLIENIQREDLNLLKSQRLIKIIKEF